MNKCYENSITCTGRSIHWRNGGDGGADPGELLGSVSEPGHVIKAYE